MGVTYGGKDGYIEILVDVDADYLTGLKPRRSVSGGIIMPASLAVYLCSRMQRATAQSTTYSK